MQIHLSQLSCHNEPLKAYPSSGQWIMPAPNYSLVSFYVQPFLFALCEVKHHDAMRPQLHTPAISRRFVWLCRRRRRRKLWICAGPASSTAKSWLATERRSTDNCGEGGGVRKRDWTKKRKRISKALINYILRENLSSLQSGAVCLNIN